MEDLPRLLFAELVDALALVRGEKEQRIASNLRIDEEGLESSDERVAAEGRGVPGNAGADHAAAVPVDAQGFQIADRLREGDVEGFDAAVEACRAFGPGAVVGATSRDPLFE